MPGVIHGEGTFEFTSVDLSKLFPAVHGGEVYKGSWDNNILHGQGLLTSPDGSTYEGSFVKGNWTGKGTFRVVFDFDPIYN